MLVDLVRVQTPDGCTLDGALQRPTVAGKSVPLDAVIVVHGTGSNFYQSTFLEFLADKFLSLGIAALRVNTRGHDGVSTAVTSRGGLRLGAAYEAVDDCRHDLAGWLTFAKAQVGPRVAFMGHSLGAVKCVYAAAHMGGQDVAAVIGLSPPRLSYERFCQKATRDEFLKVYRQAEALVQAGQGETLIEATIPMRMLISAAGFIDKYGPNERFNFLPLMSRLFCPSLFLYGSQEVESNVAFQGLPNEFAALTTLGEQRGFEVIEGADHFYSGAREQVWATIHAWISRELVNP